MYISPHFTLGEFTRSAKAESLGIDNSATPSVAANLRILADLMERIRAFLSRNAGKPVPITITSGYRCHALNAAVGSRTTSDHVKGMAADFIAPTFGTPYQIAKALQPYTEDLGIGQLIYECVGGKSWVHVSMAVPTKPLNRVITISDAGTVQGIQLVTT
jgi:zinc D-Ala-D-Ala carboxypeptidase